MINFYDSNESAMAEQSSDLNSPRQEPLNAYQHFRNRLGEEILRSRRQDHPFTVMRIVVGSTDEHLSPHTHVENALRSSIRGYDVLYTVQSGEFAIVFPETPGRFAQKIADRIRNNVNGKGKWSGPILVQTNIGLACFPEDGTNPEDLLQSAEQSLSQDRKNCTR
jgi:Diguanylate cyclase, GGDEF domain